MTVARGIYSRLVAWPELTYAVTPVTPSAEVMYYKSFTPGATLARMIDETISGRRGTPRSIVGNKDVSGQLVATLAPQSAMRMLANLIGAPATTGASAPYTHVFSLANPLPVSMGLELDYGAAIVGAGRYLRLVGVRVAKATFKFQSSGFCEVTYDLRGADFSLTATTPIDASPDDYGHSGFSMFSATLTEGGAPYAQATDLTIVWDNDLDDSLFVIGGGGVRADLPEGFCKISGQMTALYASASLITKGIDSTDSALVLTLQHGSGVGTASNEKITFNVPNLLYDVTSPPVDGPRGLRQQINYNAHQVGTSEQAASVTILSGRATL